MAPTLQFHGRGATGATLPLDAPGARAYFADVPDFFRKIQTVESVRPLGREGAYLILHHPVGGLGHTVVIAACLQAEWHDHGLRLRPLDFELEKLSHVHPLAKGFIEGELKLAAGPAGTRADFAFGVSVDLPIPKPLRLLPEALVRATGDGIMGLAVNQVVESLFARVMAELGPVAR